MVDMKAVEEYRSKLGIPKTVIAKKCGIAVNTYDNWLKKPEMVSGKNSRALADALMITEPSQLLAIFFAPNAQENLSK